jgi:hypothetical protein
MSLKAMVWAWEQDVTSTECLVLLALADHANDEGRCWPGQKGLGAKCKVSRETVNRAIKSLEAKGKLTLIPQFDDLGRPTSNHYILSIKQGGNVTDDHRGCHLKSQGYVTDDHTNLPEEESSIESSSSELAKPPVSEVEEWADSPWLLKFLKEQTTFNGQHLPRLLSHDYWADLSETTNGLALPFITREFAKMSIWLRDNPRRQPTPVGIRRFVAGWLQRAYEHDRRSSDGKTSSFGWGSGGAGNAQVRGNVVGLRR